MPPGSPPLPRKKSKQPPVDTTHEEKVRPQVQPGPSTQSSRQQGIGSRKRFHPQLAQNPQGRRAINPLETMRMERVRSLTSSLVPAFKEVHPLRWGSRGSFYPQSVRNCQGRRATNFLGILHIGRMRDLRFSLVLVFRNHPQVA